MQQKKLSNGQNLSTSQDKHNGIRQRAWGLVVREKTVLEGRKWAMGKWSEKEAKKWQYKMK